MNRLEDIRKEHEKICKEYRRSCYDIDYPYDEMDYLLSICNLLRDQLNDTQLAYLNALKGAEVYKMQLDKLQFDNDTLKRRLNSALVMSRGKQMEDWRGGYE